MPTDIQIYCNQMAEVRDRIAVVDGVLAGRISVYTEFIGTETIFLQLRKVLELIAFSTLVANRIVYAEAHKNFSEHWNAKKILQHIGKLNVDFYPMALEAPQEVSPGRKHFPRPDDGFLTQDEFVSLYNEASTVLHTNNPYATKGQAIDLQYSVPEWVARIQRLLSWHRVQLLDGSLWIINIPNQGDIQAWPAAPQN